jgi:hypothetical protein
VSSLVGRKNVAVWDERRNTSRVFPVPPDALPNALAALGRFQASQPSLYQWVTEGAPNLTHDEHFARFGEPYKTSRCRSLKDTP